jgi:phosphoglycolate phosphatase
VRITLICLGLAGTTTGRAAVDLAYAEALATVGIVPGTSASTRARRTLDQSCGLPQREIFRSLAAPVSDDGHQREAWARTAELAFDRAYASALTRLGPQPLPGAEAVLDKLRGTGLRVCLYADSDNRQLARTLDALDWWPHADLTICPDDVAGRGHPWPDMILTAALRLGIADVRQIAVIGSTTPAIQAGHRSGASVVAALRPTPEPTPTEKAAAPEVAPTHVLDTITDLPALLAEAPASTPRQ